MFGFDTGSGLGARKGKRNKRRATSCKTITFKRNKKGGKLLPRSQWTTIKRCSGPGKKLKATNKTQCRRSDYGAKGKTAHLFTKCKGIPRGARRLPALGRRRRRR